MPQVRCAVTAISSDRPSGSLMRASNRVRLGGVVEFLRIAAPRRNAAGPTKRGMWGHVTPMLMAVCTLTHRHDRIIGPGYELAREPRRWQLRRSGPV